MKIHEYSLDMPPGSPLPAEVVACELRATLADSEGQACTGSTAASRPIAAAATRLIGATV